MVPCKVRKSGQKWKPVQQVQMRRLFLISLFCCYAVVPSLTFCVRASGWWWLRKVRKSIQRALVAEIWLPDKPLKTFFPQSLPLKRREPLFHKGLSLKMFSFKCMLLYQLLWCTSFHCSQNFSLSKRLTGGEKKSLHLAVIYCRRLHFHTV